MGLIGSAARALEFTGSGLAPVSGRDLAVLGGWAVIGLLASVRFFRWDPARPAHARRARQVQACSGTSSWAAPGNRRAREARARSASSATLAGSAVMIRL